MNNGNEGRATSIAGTAASTGIFRYAEELPETRSRISLGEGGTPVVALPRLGRQIGLPNLFAKLEGSNPTGSYKDRVAAMSISLAADAGRAGWVATSSGNAGAALAAYGNRAGLPGFLAAVSSIPREKLLPILGLGNVQVVKIAGVGDAGSAESESAMFEQVRAAASRYDLYLGVTAHRYNEYGMHGADTIAYELDDAGFGRALVYVPSGGGGLAAAICRGFRTRGASARVVAAQPSGCAPIVSCLRRKIAEPRIEHCTTEVSGLQLPAPPDGQLAVDSIIATNGWGTSASDDEIHAGQRLLAAQEGVFVEPAGAAALAAAIRDRDSGRLAGDDTVVLILTSTGSKHLASVEHAAARPVTLQTAELPNAIAGWAAGLSRSGNNGYGPMALA